MLASQFKPLLLAKFPYLCPEGLEYIDEHIAKGSTLEQLVNDKMTLERYFMYLSALGVSRKVLYDVMLSMTDSVVDELYKHCSSERYIAVRDRLKSKERFEYDYTDVFSIDDADKAPKILLCIVIISYPFKVNSTYFNYKDLNELIVEAGNRMMSPVIIGNSNAPQSKFVGA